MRARFEAWGRPALELIAPPQCAGCGLVGAAWCRQCRDRTILLAADLCPTCGGRMRGETCPQCARYEAVYRQARSYAEYRPPFRSLVIHLKYTPDRALGELAAGLVLETAAALLSTTERARTIVVPVPLSPKRLKQRGYNQVDPFGRPLAARLGLPYRPDALRRTRETRSQVGLTPDQRTVNLQSAFEADPGAAAGRHVLLLDDVFTSGATGNSCTRALLGAGAESVRVLTLARAVPGEDR